MPRKRRNPKTRRAEISAEMIDYLSDRETDKDWKFFIDDAEFLAAWNELRDEILAEWIVESPGTRPSAWWKYDAPRQPVGTFPGWYYDGKLPQPRLRLGGVGTEGHEVLNIVPHYAFGIPTKFVDRWEQSYYNGRSRDIHGKPIGTEYEEGHFAGVAPDPNDPPTFESEAAYLRRLDLLLPGELERLTEADFEPELVEPEDDDEAA